MFSVITQVFDTLWEIVEHFYASKVDSFLI
jgi:hypothetical protein